MRRLARVLAGVVLGGLGGAFGGYTAVAILLRYSSSGLAGGRDGLDKVTAAICVIGAFGVAGAVAGGIIGFRKWLPRNVFLLAAVVSACGLGFWGVTTARRQAAESQLRECLGQPAGEVVRRLRLGDADRHWADEPPGILRGVMYSPADGGQVTLYIAEGEPLFRRFNDRREWDYSAFLQCRIGGIQSETGGVHLDIGPAFPWQFRH